MLIFISRRSSAQFADAVLILVMATDVPGIRTLISGSFKSKGQRTRAHTSILQQASARRYIASWTAAVPCTLRPRPAVMAAAYCSMVCCSWSTSWGLRLAKTPDSMSILSKLLLLPMTPALALATRLFWGTMAIRGLVACGLQRRAYTDIEP
jgi:hypothetical protein